MAEPVPDFAEVLNAQPEGWVRAMGLRITRATEDEVECEWVVGPEHLQGYGIVHGGVHCGVVETLASIGAALWARPRGLAVAGLENTTSFLRAVRSGTLRARATPVSRGRRTQVWECEVRDEGDRPVATGRVRLVCLDPELPLAGQAVSGTRAMRGWPKGG
jgi:uncharacterized protein (TIGR00369 family)